MMHFLAQDTPSKIAISSVDQSLSFSQLQEAVVAMSLSFKKLPKGILLLQAESSPQFVIQLLAALHINQPVALIAAQDSEQKHTLLSTCMTVNSQGDLVTRYENNQINHHPELALVLFTSGSTGDIKAVQLSQKNIQANCQAIIKALEFSKIENQVLFLPLSYSFGLLGQLLPGLITGIETKLITQFTDIKTLLETTQAPQMWSGVPSHWVAMSKMASLYPEGAAQIKAVVSAGAPLSTSLRANLKQAFPNATVYNNYGLTEASPRVLTYSSNDPLFMEDYAGYPVGDWQTRLTEEHELLIKGSQMMLGYLGDETPSKIKNGWLYTGDLAEILPSGLVAIKGRIDNLVNIAGEKVNLIEIEHKICHIAGIKEVLVVPLADALYGVRLVACLEHNAFTATHTEEQLTEQLKQLFLPKKFPISVRFLEKLPRNHHGKLDRKTRLLNP